MDRSQRSLPRETLARNLQFLMDLHGYTEAVVAKRADVSQKSVNNLLHQRHPPNLEVVDKVAGAFGLNLWQIILPNLPRDVTREGGTLAKLVDSYLEANNEGQKLVLQLAEREAKYGGGAQ